jgi:hypothetical protein
MDLFDAIRLARGLFWFVIGTAIFITGVIMTIGTLIGGYDHEWYVGPLALLAGAGAAGYFSIWRIIREEQKRRR